MFFIFDFFIIKLICEEWLKLFFYFGVCNFCFLFCIFLKPLLSLFICFFLWEVFVSDFFLDGPNIFRMPHIFLSLSLSAIKVVLYSFIDITQISSTWVTWVFHILQFALFFLQSLLALLMDQSGIRYFNFFIQCPPLF